MGNKAKEQPGALRVLIVEDEMLVALELESLLCERGCIVVGPAAGVDQALALLDDQEPDIALLDINLGGRLVTPVAAALSVRGVPFALLTADPQLAVGEHELAEAPILEKPFSYRSLIAAVVQLAERSGRRKPSSEDSQPAFVGDRSLVIPSLALLMDNIADELWFCDAFGNVVLANRAGLRNLGLAELEDVVQPAEAWFSKLEIFEGKNRPRAPQDAPLLRSLKGEVITNCEEAIRHPKTGRMLHREVFSAPIRAGNGAIVGSVAVVRDVTERREAEERVRRLALHDALTGLPNRTLLHDRLAHAIALARREGAEVAVLILDLDHFKDVNDTLGHHEGDQLLCSVARRLSRIVRDSDTLARLGGDEFALVQDQVRAPADAVTLASKILDALSAPFHLGGLEVYAPASIGIALFPDDGSDPAELLKNADLALYRAKNQGRFRFRLFEPAMDAEVQARKLLELELRRAIRREELVLEYQPQLDLSSGRFVGVEALVRWRHPRRGLVLPGEFIPVAEASGLIRALGEWVLHQACRQGEAWNKNGCSLTVAVNLSPAQLKHNHLGLMVGHALTQASIEPGHLEFEITEGVLIEKLEQGEDSCLLDLTARGVRLAIDDFGIGYSSLSYLKQLPVAKIKIDRSFVRDIATEPDADALVRAMIVLGHNLGKRVAAEGVETEQQLALLRQFGCDYAQGFLLARPQSAERIQSLLIG
jgi:diguanylate cyclase (GGDEF)-like protein/PAS domain S-box-containing protein